MGDTTCTDYEVRQGVRADERNRKLFEDRATGMTYAMLADKYDISQVRAKQVAENEARRISREERNIANGTERISRLSRRVQNRLRGIGITTDEQAARATDGDLLKIYHFGMVGLTEVRALFPNPEPNLDALAAERDALRAYAKAVELKWWNEVNDRASGHPDTDNLIEDFRAEHGVTDLMDADREGAE